MLPLQAVDLRYPRTDCGQTPAKAIKNALLNLAADHTAAYAAQGANTNVLHVESHTLNCRAKHINGKRA